MEMAKVLPGILAMAIVTYLIRVIPMLVFRKPIRSAFIRSMLYYVPYAVLAAMTFPAIFVSDSPLIAVMGGTAAAIVCAWYRRSLITVACVAAVVVYVISLFC